MVKDENGKGKGPKLLHEWRWAVLRSSLPSTQKLTLLALSIHMSDGGGGAFPSYTTLGHETGLGRSTVVEAVKAVKGTWLEVENRWDRPCS